MDEGKTIVSKKLSKISKMNNLTKKMSDLKLDNLDIPPDNYSDTNRRLRLLLRER